MQDANYNSWDAVQTFDAYIHVAGASTGPRIVGEDKQGPQLETTAGYIASSGAQNTFLLRDNSGTISVSSIHVTEEDDADVITLPHCFAYTEDAELANVWGYVNGGVAAKTPQQTVYASSSRSMVRPHRRRRNNIDDTIAYVVRPSAETLNNKAANFATTFSSAEF